MLHEIASHRLAGVGRLAPNAEQIVDGLKGRPDVGAELGERADRGLGGTGEDGPQRDRAGEERRGLPTFHVEALRHGDRGPRLERHIVTLAGDHDLRGLDQARRGAHALGRRLFEHDLEGQRGQRVPGNDGLPDPELAPYGGAVSPLGVAVDDVIVDEREIVDQLDGHGTDDAGLLGCSRR